MYRDYGKFDPISFQSDIKDILAEDNKACLVFEKFYSIVEELMNKHAPIEQKYLRTNDAPFMTKTLRKAIMLRTQLSKGQPPVSRASASTVRSIVMQMSF